MLKFIKGLFETSKEPSEEIVSDIEVWVNQKKELCEAKIRPELQNFRNTTARMIEKVQKELIQLKEAKLKNPNIPKKALHIMEGNRDAYIKRTNDFLNSLDTDIQDSEDASQFIAAYKEGLEGLGKSNSKSNMILSEFFGDNIKRIAYGIKQLERQVNSLSAKLKDTGNEGIDQIKELSNHLKNNQRHLEEIRSQKDELIMDLEEETKKMHDLKEKMEEIKASDEYIMLKKQKKEKADLDSQLKALEYRLKGIFSDIESGLKKYSRLSLEQKLIDFYLDNPLLALRKDSELKILDILNSMLKSAVDNKLELKPKKQEKTIMAIESLDKSLFSQIKDEQNRILRLRKGVEEMLSKNTVMNNFAEQEYLLTHSEQKIKHLKRAIDSNENQINNAKIEDLHKEIKKIALNTLSIKISLAS